jgi:hypothetical protein
LLMDTHSIARLRLPLVSETLAAAAVAHAKYLTSEVGNGRLQLYQAVQAWRQSLGLL